MFGCKTVETGVDSCYRVQNATYNQGSDTLTWQLNAVAGQQNYVNVNLDTVYGFTVWAGNGTPSGVLQKVTSLPKTATSLSNVSKLIIPSANWSELYVEMVGMPLIMNEMSNATPYP